MNINDIKPAKILQTHFEIIVVTTQGRSPFPVEAQTPAEARALAEKRAGVHNLAIVELGSARAFSARRDARRISLHHRPRLDSAMSTARVCIVKSAALSFTCPAGASHRPHSRQSVFARSQGQAVALRCRRLTLLEARAQK